jgi:hypothetical protein
MSTTLKQRKRAKPIEACLPIIISKEHSQGRLRRGWFFSTVGALLFITVFSDTTN